MRKLQRAAVVGALLSSAGLIGTGTAHADGWGWGGHHIHQSTSCKSHDLNIDILGNVGVLNGLAGNLINGKGNPGANVTGIGSSMGCNNSIL